MHIFHNALRATRGVTTQLSSLSQPRTQALRSDAPQSEEPGYEVGGVIRTLNVKFRLISLI
jgi:hypothetical protein